MFAKLDAGECDNRLGETIARQYANALGSIALSLSHVVMALHLQMRCLRLPNRQET